MWALLRQATEHIAEMGELASEADEETLRLPLTGIVAAVALGLALWGAIGWSLWSILTW